MASSLLHLLATPCHELLPSFLAKPLFTSNAFVPSPSSVPIPLYGALLPPTTYFLALFLLSDPRPHPGAALLAAQHLLAALSAAAFIALPFAYHVPGSAIFTYQLGLIGCFGAARVLDIFFLSRPRKPQRIALPQPGCRAPTRGSEEASLPALHGLGAQNGNATVYPPGTDNLAWQKEAHPRTVPARLWWALDLMVSMRGIGWDFASADVRHDVSPWQPPSTRQLRAAATRLVPVLLGTILVTRALLAVYVEPGEGSGGGGSGRDIAGGYWSSLRLRAGAGYTHAHAKPSIADVPGMYRPVLVLATGISLYTLFDAGYTLVSAVLLPLLNAVAAAGGGSGGGGAAVVAGGVAGGGKTPAAPAPAPPPHLHNLDFFPLLNPLKLTQIRSVRSFWSKAWHRLFHRAFLVFGILPLQNLALWAFPRRQRRPVARSGSGSGNRRGEDKGQGQGEGDGDDNPPATVPLLCPSQHPDPARALPRGTHDWAKVLGAFLASGLVHAVSERAALGGRVALPGNNLWLMAGFGGGVGVGGGGHGVAAPLGAGVGGALFGGGAGPTETGGKYSATRLVPPFSGGGELTFFALNGLAVLLEGCVGAAVVAWRRRRRGVSRGRSRVPSGSGSASSADSDSDSDSDSDKPEGSDDSKDRDRDRATDKAPPSESERWYDAYVGLGWAVAVLLWSGEAFVEGWIKSGILAELTFMPR